MALDTRMEEKFPERSLYKLMLGSLKVIPMLLAALAILNMLFDFAGIDSSFLSMLGGVSILPLIFIYLAGDGARELADIICEMGCPNCNPD